VGGEGNRNESYGLNLSPMFLPLSRDQCYLMSCLFFNDKSHGRAMKFISKHHYNMKFICKHHYNFGLYNNLEYVQPATLFKCLGLNFFIILMYV